MRRGDGKDMAWEGERATSVEFGAALWRGNPSHCPRWNY